MKISGGAAKGIPIHVPKTDGLRPASSSSRERLFSSLGKRVEGAFFLDLFCGSGSYGLEAVSRGAKSGAFVDRDFRATQCVRRNLAQVCKSANRLDDNFEIVTCDVLKWKSRDVVCRNRQSFVTQKILYFVFIASMKVCLAFLK